MKSITLHSAANRIFQYALIKSGLAVLLSLFILTGIATAQSTFPESDGFTLPEGKSIVITYEVEVNDTPCPGGDEFPLHLVNQSTVSGSNFSDILTYFSDDSNPDPTLFPLAVNPGCFTENRVYVDGSATGFQDGTGWSSPFIDLQTAFEVGCGNDFEVWVAQGTYLPDEGTEDRNRSFELCNSLSVFGGFDGSESTLTERDLAGNITTLSGNINGTSTLAGNSYSVVTGPNTDQTALLDGFTITMGNADEDTGDTTAPERSGGGLYLNNGDPTLRNLIVTNNSANSEGGGMLNLNSDPVLTNVLITNNMAGIGGGLANVGSTPVLTNATITGNSAANNGGGINNTSSSPSFTNSIIWDNEADATNSTLSASIFNTSSTPTFANSIISNSGGSFSWDTNAGQDDGNNLDSDPLFTDSGNDDFSITNLSPAINAGDNTPFESGGIAENVLTDIAGNPRIFDGIPDPDLVDIGAYEFQGEPLLPPGQVVLLSPADHSINIALTPEFEWDNIDAAETYQLQVSVNSDLSGPVINESDLENTTFETTTELDRSTIYYWRVRASNQAGTGDWSEVFSFTTVPESSEIVVLISPANEAEDISLTPLFEWNSADGADTYDLEVAPNPDFTDPVINESGITETEFQTVSDLSVSTIYYWRVRGVNAGGPGGWSNQFSFTTSSPPDGQDQRLLVSNSGEYEFSGADFGVSQAGYSVRIISVPADGTLSAELDEQLSINQINSGGLTWTAPAGQHGYEFTSFGFRIIDDFGLESDQVFTMTIDLAASSVELTGGEGWRFITSPATGETIGGFLMPVWTQGFAGSNNPGASFTNVQKLDQDNYVWDPNVDSADEFERGLGLIVFVFNDHNGNGSEVGFPRTLTSLDTWTNLSEEFDYTPLLNFTDSPPNDDSFFLVANPHPVSLDFCEFTQNNVASSIAVWDPNYNAGDYRTLSCDADDVYISPFQAYWVRTTASNPTLSIPEDAYLQTMADGFFKENGNKNEDGFLVQLEVTREDKAFSNRVSLLFREDATFEMDRFDAPKLNPAGLTNEWLSFYSIGQGQKTYALQSLPINFESNLTIPLDIQATHTGRFDMNWTLPESQFFNGSYFLKDTQTGDVIELRESSSYGFDIIPDNVFHSEITQNSQIADIGDLINPTIIAGSSPRFELLIASEGTDGRAELGDLPDTFTLNQNYPNPFNPTTIISYELPQTANVKLEVYDMTGRQVATLVNRQVAAGRHTVNFDASNLSSGVYMYSLQAGGMVITRQLTLIK